MKEKNVKLPTKKQLLVIARKTLLDLKAQSIKGLYLDNFAVVCEDGTVGLYKNQPCYGLLVNWGNGRGVFTSKPVFFLTYHRLKVDITVAEKYANWAAKRSPYKDVFVEKSGKNIIEKGAILSCNFPPQMVIGAAIMMRYKYEYPTVVRQWDIFRKYMSDDMAFVFSHFFKKQNKNFYIFNQNAIGHDMLDRTFSNDCLKNFLRHHSVFFKKTVSDQNFNYQGLTSLWGNRSKVSYASDPVWEDGPKWPALLAEVKVRSPWGGEDVQKGGRFDTLEEDIKATVRHSGVMDA